MDTQDYIGEAERQLSNEKYYKKISKDLTTSHTTTVNHYLEGLLKAGEINNKLRSRILTHDPKTPAFYLLPKIHKPGFPPPGRPIVSANSCATEKISALTDLLLRPLAQTIPSYLKDTPHFLEVIKEKGKSLPPHTLLCTLDVTSLYTNIPNEEGRIAVAHYLSKHRPQRLIPEGEPSNSSLLTLLKMVLEFNNFEFNGTHYLQVGGTAMGTRVAPTLANLFMGHFEEKFVFSKKPGPHVWVRFIDDIFMIWTHGRESLKVFLEELNNAHPSIKFTSCVAEEGIPFLDTLVCKDDQNNLYTTLYTKPTDANNFLHFKSAHPPHCKRGIPGGQFLRIRRICTKDKDFIQQSFLKAAHFRARGYPLDLIARGLLRAWQQGPNQKAPNPQTEPNSTNILVTTFHPTFNNLNKIVRKNWDILSHSSKTRDIFQKDLLVSLRRPPNLRSLLIRARTDFQLNNPLKHLSAISGRTYNICNTLNCRYCTRLDTTGRIRSPVSGREYSSKSNVSCQSSNVIYCLSCKRCKKQYIGQTKRRLMDRFQDHFYKINKALMDTDMGSHFNTDHHEGLDDVEIHIVDFIHCNPESPRAAILRNVIEKNWIFRLKSQSPNGLNLIDAPSF